VNYVRGAVQSGLGNNPGTPNRNDVQPNFTAELALASNASDLVDRMNAKLMYGTMPTALKNEIVTAVNSIVIRTNTPANTDADKRSRVNAAVFLTLVSPEFQVQK
jgi:hypothetical protein